ncbi:MAG: hypothetical protein ACI80L_001563, partial [Pseudohongiellaceae bacterium]
PEPDQFAESELGQPKAGRSLRPFMASQESK